MRVIRYFIGFLLALVGVLFALGAAMLVVAPDPEIPIWAVGVMLLALGVLPLAVAFVLLRPMLTRGSNLCPQCGSRECRPAGVLRSSMKWWVNLLAWPLAALWHLSRRQQVRCHECETLYFTDSTGTRVFGVLFWILALLFLSVIVAQLAL